MNQSLKNSITILALFLIALKFYPAATVISFLWVLYLLVEGAVNLYSRWNRKKLPLT
ncbi:MAG: hypothetical protein HN842_10900 [Gammaproteobacteria bacterium]|nr:hypothetical protein [Gammaproteobacteria bacterium]